MAAQETRALHGSQYPKMEPPSDGYDYGYQTGLEGPYYNPYVPAHYGEQPDPHGQHHGQVEPPHQQHQYHESLSGAHLQAYPQPSGHENLHYGPQSHMGSHPYAHPGQHVHPQMVDGNPHPSHYGVMMAGPDQGNRRPQEAWNHSGRYPPGMYKDESMEDPYSFVDEDPSMMHRVNAAGGHAPGMPPGAQPPFKAEHMALAPGNGGVNPLAPAPKKRGRKKKVQPEMNENMDDMLSPLGGLELPMHDPMTPDGVQATGSAALKRKYTKSEHYKQRRRHDRFNGMSEDEVRLRTLPDHLTTNLDVVIIGINPGLFAAYKGHHYAGPGNHFWKCLYLAGLVPEPMTADDDFKLLHYGIGFTNMVARATKGSADLTRKEIREGGRILLEKLQRFRPKIAVFNGKGIYEVFSGKKEFTFGKQPEYIDGTNTYIWVMPSSSARCAQLPRAMDKVPFYSALKKFRDFLNGLIPEIDDSEVVFNDPKIRAADDGTEISDHLKEDLPCTPSYLSAHPAGSDSFSSPSTVGDADRQSVPPPQGLPAAGMGAEGGMGGMSMPHSSLHSANQPMPVVKKKRGRPKKIRTDENGQVIQAPPSNSVKSHPAEMMMAPGLLHPAANGSVDGLNGAPPKKKRGRPKKIRVEDVHGQSPAQPTVRSPQVDGLNGSAGAHNHLQNHCENGTLGPGPPSMAHSPVVGAPSPYPPFNPSGSNHHAHLQHHQHPQHHGHHHVLAGQSGHAPAMDYYVRSPPSAGPVPGGGPLSGLCNDGVSPSPHDGSMQNMANHLHHPHSMASTSQSPSAVSSPSLRPAEYPVGNGETSVAAASSASTSPAVPSTESTAAAGPSSVDGATAGDAGTSPRGPPTPARAVNGSDSGDSSLADKEANSDCGSNGSSNHSGGCGASSGTAASSSNNPNGHQQQPQQQHLANQSASVTSPSGSNYRTAASAPAPVGNASYQKSNQDVASKSLSGLESLVDQIPAMGADGEASHALAVHSHLNAHSAGGVVNSAAPFGHYTPTSAQANFPTYSSSPYAVPHYPPHSYSVAPVTSAPHGFPSSNPYGQGAQSSAELGFGGPSYSNAPSGGGMFTSSGHAFSAYPPYGQYHNLTGSGGYPYSPHGFHPHASAYAPYPGSSSQSAPSASSYGTPGSYPASSTPGAPPAAAYLNSNQHPQ